MTEETKSWYFYNKFPSKSREYSRIFFFGIPWNFWEYFHPLKLYFFCTERPHGPPPTGSEYIVLKLLGSDPKVEKYFWKYRSSEQVDGPATPVRYCDTYGWSPTSPECNEIVVEPACLSCCSGAALRLTVPLVAVSPCRTCRTCRCCSRSSRRLCAGHGTKSQPPTWTQFGQQAGLYKWLIDLFP